MAAVAALRASQKGYQCDAPHIASRPIGSRRLSAVLPSEVQAWASERAAVLAPITLRNLVGLLRSIYASAVLDRLVASSPVVRLTLPAAHRERVTPLTVDEVRGLAAAMPARNRAMVLTQAGLGLRIGELLALRVEDVNFLRRTVRVEWQIAPGSKVRSVPETRRSRPPDSAARVALERTRSPSNELPLPLAEVRLYRVWPLFNEENQNDEALELLWKEQEDA